MTNSKTYTLDTITNFNNEAEKYKALQKERLTIDDILIQSKKTALELVKIGCNATELAKMYKSVGIDVSINKIRQLYFKPKKSGVNKQTELTKKVDSIPENI